MNTVSRRFGSSTLMSLRLFSRAPCTRIRSWLSAAGFFVAALLIVSPSVPNPVNVTQTTQAPSRINVRPAISLASRQACSRTGRSTRNT